MPKIKEKPENRVFLFLHIFGYVFVGLWVVLVALAEKEVACVFVFCWYSVPYVEGVPIGAPRKCAEAERAFTLYSLVAVLYCVV